MKEHIVLLIDGNKGIYVPQEFAKCFNPENSYWVYSLKDAAILKEGPDNEFYWEIWQDVLDSAIYQEEGKPKFRLEEYEGNLFAIEEGHELGEDLENEPLQINLPAYQNFLKYSKKLKHVRRESLSHATTR